jgi:metal-dependent amidase/aminoacylase/carboxypeptidase family protein
MPNVAGKDKALAAIGLALVKGRHFLGAASRLGLGQAALPGARLDTGRAGPKVCLRVDIDGLPIAEAATLAIFCLSQSSV